MKRAFCFIVTMLILSCALVAQESDLSVAERNAQQGFNDTIDRLAPDFVEVSLLVCDPGEILYSAFGHAMLHLKCPTFGLDYIFTRRY